MIPQTIIEDVAAKVEATYLGEALIQTLRGVYPDIHFTYCADDDVGVNAKPVLERPGFKVYLVDSREHCACLTNNQDIATGMVLAEACEDDV